MGIIDVHAAVKSLEWGYSFEDEGHLRLQEGNSTPPTIHSWCGTPESQTHDFRAASNIQEIPSHH
jgi:hypothetical protein